MKAPVLTYEQALEFVKACRESWQIERLLMEQIGLDQLPHSLMDAMSGKLFLYGSPESLAVYLRAVADGLERGPDG